MGITRDDVVNDRIRKRMIEEGTGIENLLSEAEFEQSRADVLKQFENEDELWIFGYGSLIWSPTFEFVEQAVAQLPGCSRKFCLWAHTGRGSPEQPGLWLGLDTGGSCTGIAFRVDNAVRDYETLMLWRREMISGAYMPRVMPVVIDGQEKACICLLANKSHQRYAGELPFEEIVNCIATGCGHLGTCEEYLFNLIEKLDSVGVHDEPMHALAAAVRQHPNQSNG
jgi:cation transport protein ChaC